MRRLGWAALAALLAASVAAELLIAKEGPAPWWSHWGFFAWFGFAGCVAIVLVSKLLGRWWLQRPEDYYDAERDDG